MDFSLYVKHDSWWDKPYDRLTIKNYMSIPIFYKLYQIKGEFEYTFVNYFERFSCINDIETLEIQTLDKKFKELASRNIRENSWFYYKLFQEIDHELEIESNLNVISEYGKEKKTFNENVWEVWTWNKTKDILGEYEHFPDRKTELFTLELNLSKSEVVNGSIVKTLKKTEFSFYSFEQTEIITSAQNKTEIYEKVLGDLIEKSTTKETSCSKTVNKSRDAKGFVEEIYESSDSNSKVFRKTVSAKAGSQVLIEGKKEKVNKHSGFKSLKINQKGLNIKWRIVSNQLFCEISIIYDSQMSYCKRIIKDEVSFIEIDYFKNNSKLWGSIKDYSENGSMNISWRVKKPNIYNTYVDKYSQQRKTKSEESPNKSLYTLLNLIKFEADFVFDIFETLDDYSTDIFSGLTMHLFSEQSPAFENLNGNFGEKLCDYLKFRNEFDGKFNEENSIGFFQYSNYQDNKLLIDQIYRKEKMFSFVLESIKISKKLLYCREFVKEVYFKIQPFVFSLLYSVSLIKTFGSKYNQPSFTVTKHELVDSDTLNMFCTVCNTECHFNCQVSVKETSLNSPSNEKCKSFISKKSRTNCKICPRSCSPKYHLILKKSIQTTEILLKTTEFNSSHEKAKENLKTQTMSLKSSNLLQTLNSKLEHFLILTTKKLKKHPNNQDLRLDLENFKEVLKVVNNNGA